MTKSNVYIIRINK